MGTRHHEHTPLVKVQGWSEVPRGRPLFDTIVVYENHTLDTMLRTQKVGRDRLGFSYHGQTNYPLTLIAYGDDEMLVRLENDRRRVDDAPASRMLGHLVTLLTAMPGHADRMIHELPLLTVEERASFESAEARLTFPPDRCLHQRFEEQARRVPGRVAAVCDEESLTYGQLDRRANALALKLRSLGVGPDALVGIRTERSLNIIVGILGILKAGGAYLPLDPAYPKDRVEFMLADSRVGVVVTETGRAADFAGSGAKLVLLDREREEAGQGPEPDVGPRQSRLRDLHVGLDGQAEGRPRHPRQRDPTVRRDPGLVPVRRGRRLDAVPFVRVRLLGVGDLGRAALRRPAGRGPLLGEPLARGLPRTAAARAGDGAQPDAVGVPPVDPGRRAVGAAGEDRRCGT